MLENSISFGRYGQWVAALAATFSVLISGNVIAWPSAAFPKMIDGTAGMDFSISEKAWLASLPFAGAFSSPIPCSYIMDKIGRKNTLNCTVLLVIINWIMMSLSDNIYVLCLARYMSGLWCGSEYIIVSIYVAEIVDPDIRGSLISVTGLMFYSGALYVSLISYFSYQMLNLLCALPSLLLFTVFLFMPESPYYYLMRGEKDKAVESLTWLRGYCDPAEINRIEEGVTEQLKHKGTFKEIVSVKSNRNALILIQFFKFFASCAAGLMLFSFSTVLLPNSWVSSQNSYILLCIVWVFAALFSSFIMDRYPRRKILAVSCVGSIVFYSCTTVWYYLREFTTVDVSTTAWIPLLTVIIGSFFELIGIVNIPNVLKGEMFPINVKTKACALSCMTACGFETLNAFFFYDLNKLIGMYFTFLKAVLSAILCLYILIFHMFETKGLNLETIQQMLTGNVKVKEENPKQLKPVK